jgi:hypothetical protein
LATDAGPRSFEETLAREGCSEKKKPHRRRVTPQRISSEE